MPRRWLVLAPLLFGVLLAACSSASPSAGGHTTTTTAASSASTTVPPVDEVKVGSVPGLGTVLVDGQGMTLYIFEPDHQSGRSTCYGPCATGWPPLVVPAGATTPVAGPGVRSSLLGTTARTDGTTQVTYHGWPLYLWVNDTAPGQATGQGLNNLGGLWYVLSPTGQVITARA
jgi:predicted lipoprotein with Yx(FWY)xxD motif